MSFTPEQLNALKKIRKCLALAGSNNEHEAAAAMRQAHALMKKHGLNESSVHLSEIGERGVKATGSTGIQSWEAYLAATIAEAFGLKSAFQSGDYNFRTGRRGRGSILFIGPDARITVASYCYECLHRQLKRCLAEKRKLYGGVLTGRNAKVFAESWTVSACEKVSLLASQFDDGPLIEEYCRSVVTGGDKKPRKAATASGIDGDLDRAIATLGYREGDKAQLNPAMNGRDEAARIGVQS
jgi:hypothetical protein